MTLFNLFVRTLAEADRLAADANVAPVDQQRARQLHSALVSLKGAAFALREYTTNPPPAEPAA